MKKLILILIMLFFGANELFAQNNGKQFLVIIKNDYDKEMLLVIRYREGSTWNNEMVSKTCIIKKGGRRVFITPKRKFYYYAIAKDGYTWSGECDVEIDDGYFNMRKGAIPWRIKRGEIFKFTLGCRNREK